MRSKAVNRLLEEMEKRPWYEKMWASFKVMRWTIRCTYRNIMMKEPISIEAANDVALSIKDDIEFGYDLDMIYGKIMTGSYGNEELPIKSDWYSRNNISWEAYLDRGGRVALTALQERIEQMEEVDKTIIINEITKLSQEILTKQVERDEIANR